MASVSLNLSVEELSKINGNIKYARDDIEHLLKQIGTKYSELCNSIGTTELLDLLQSIETMIYSISGKTTENFDLFNCGSVLDIRGRISFEFWPLEIKSKSITNVLTLIAR